MSLVFLNIAALGLVAALAGPLVIHLLVRRPSRRVPFPSLRFVPRRASQAARLRQLADWPLLLVRLAILAVAALAFAQPLLVTPLRLSTWEQRVSRLVVVDTSPSTVAAREEMARLAEQARRDTVGAVVLETSEVDRAVRHAGERLASFPPSRRELVVISDFQEGTMDERSTAMLPPGVGIRLLGVRPRGGQRLAKEASGLPEIRVAPSDAVASRLAARAVAVTDGVADSRSPVILATTDAPGAEELADRAVPLRGAWMAALVARVRGNRTWIHAAREDQRGSGLALSRNARSDPFIPLAGSDLDFLYNARPDPSARAVAAAVGQQVLVLTDVRPASFAFPALLSALHQSGEDQHLLREMWLPMMSADRIAALERPATEVPAESVRNSEQSDARWLWAAVAILLFAEGRLRRRQAAATVTREAAA